MRELGPSSNLEKRRLRGNLTNVHKYLMGSSKEDQAKLSSVVSRERMRGNGHKFNTQEIPFKHKQFFIFFFFFLL